MRTARYGLALACLNQNVGSVATVFTAKYAVNKLFGLSGVPTLSLELGGTVFGRIPAGMPELS